MLGSATKVRTSRYFGPALRMKILRLKRRSNSRTNTGAATIFSIAHQTNITRRGTRCNAGILQTLGRAKLSRNSGGLRAALFLCRVGIGVGSGSGRVKSGQAGPLRLGRPQGQLAGRRRRGQPAGRSFSIRSISSCASICPVGAQKLISEKAFYGLTYHVFP